MPVAFIYKSLLVLQIALLVSVSGGDLYWLPRIFAVLKTGKEYGKLSEKSKKEVF
jgi:hypothetical protein